MISLFEKTPAKKLGAVILLTLLAFAIATSISHAQAGVEDMYTGDMSTSYGNGTNDSGDSCGIILGSISGCIYLMVDLVNWIMHLFIALGAKIVDYMISLDKELLNMAAVQSGFNVSLAIANLVFVLGIIVIALATILRRETYGIKQILWKLIFIAIMVNFGLVVSGVILNFSGQLTKYFTDAADSNGGSLATNLASAFGVSKDVIPPADNISPNPDLVHCYAACTDQNGDIPPACTDQCEKNAQSAANTNNSGNSVSSGMDSAAKALLALVFAIIFDFIIAFSFFAIGIMLVIRFIYIAILLIILPIAWAAFVFPKFSHLFSKWWSSFFRWAFFPAIATFFLYLAMLTATKMKDVVPPLGVSENNDPGTAVASMTNNPGLIEAFTNLLIVSGLAIGGLFAANSLGIAGASVAMEAMKSVGTAAQGYVGKQTKKGARLAYQKAGGERIERGLREGAISKQVKRLPVVGGAAGWVVGRGEREAALGLGKITKNEKMVDQEKGRLKGKSEGELKELLNSGNLNTEMKFAAIDLLREQGKASNDMKIDRDSSTAGKFMSDHNTIKRFGQEKMTGDYNRATGSTIDTRNSEEALKSAMPKAKEEGEKAYQAATSSPATTAAAMKKLEVEAEAEAEKAYAETKKDERIPGSADAIRDKVRADYMSKNVARLSEYEKTIAEGERKKAEDEYLENNSPNVKVAEAIRGENGEVMFKAGEEAPAAQVLKEGMREFAAKLTTSDAARLNANESFGKNAYAEHPLATERLLTAIAENNQRIIPTIIRNMNSQTLATTGMKKIPELLQRLIEKQQATVTAMRTAGEREEKIAAAEIKLNQLNNAKDGVERTIQNYFGTWEYTGGGGKEEAGGGATGGGGGGKKP